MADSFQLLIDIIHYLWLSVSQNLATVLIYSIPLLAFSAIFLKKKYSASQENLSAIQSTKEKGLTEPASLHPLIDPHICIGCGACVSACPEGDVLGLIGERAHLINPTHCIGHGACKAACPMDAISLVFGTARRGVDIPVLKPTFETSVPGIFIAGELGGMGLIRNAVEQGRQAMESIKKAIREAPAGPSLDVVIVGAGPAGFSASLAALQDGLKYAAIEQDSLGGAVAHFPRGKLVMTQPADLPIVGKIKITETRKESLLGFWQTIEKKTGVKIQYHERMESIRRTEHGLEVKTSKNLYLAKTVLLAIGRRGTPRKLGIPGEDLSKVVYALIDPEQYRNQHVLMVGGGNSALEGAASLAEEPGTVVTLSYRGNAFTRANDMNRTRVEMLAAEGRLTLLLESNVKEIKENSVVIEQHGSIHEIPNQIVIVNAGGILPTPFLKQLGIVVETKHGAP